MKNVVIAISDDLDIFDSVEKAESYFESWILEEEHGLRVFDQSGLSFKCEPRGNFIKLLATNKQNVEELRSAIINHIARLKNGETHEIGLMSLENLILHLIKIKGFTK